MIYLDNSATTFKKPPKVLEALRAAAQCANPGRGSHFASIAASELIYGAREEAALLLGTRPEHIAFTLNATHALNLAIKGSISGGRIITTDFEHNSVRRPIMKLCAKGCTSDIISTSDPSGMARVLYDLTQEKASALVCIHKSNVTGRTIPLRELGDICRKRGILFIVDASQSAGNVTIDMERDKIDLLCTASHKGLMGIQGTGIIAFGRELPIETLMEGGSGSDSRSEAMPSILPDRLEAGTLPTPAIAALAEGIRFIRQAGADEIGRKEASLWLRCREMLSCCKNIKIYDTDYPGANFLFNIKGRSASAVAEELDRYGICVRSGLHCAPAAHDALGSSGAVRASFGYYTTVSEVDRFIRCVRSIAFI